MGNISYSSLSYQGSTVSIENHGYDSEKYVLRENAVMFILNKFSELIFLSNVCWSV